jgi:hypothetical protein
VTAAVAAQPPGGVVLGRGIIREAETPQGFGLVDRVPLRAWHPVVLSFSHGKWIRALLALMLALVVATVPVKLRAEGAVSVSPPVNVVVSPEPSFKITEPVFRKVVAPARVFVVPVMEMV